MSMFSAGITRASRPDFVPSHTTSCDAARSRRASASAGNTWPPVPPAMMRIGADDAAHAGTPAPRSGRASSSERRTLAMPRVFCMAS